ncbi:hypothetical protein [Pseudomonas sp. TR47]|uniref:hypothetical protein n=1 Tax=Pseudomonas sp. TR47 TaxID=3342639 RepID=UPI00377052A2
MENLWPLDILSPNTDNDSYLESAHELLEAQALGISARTNRLLGARVDIDQTPLGNTASFYLFPASNPTKSVQLLVYRSGENEFPALLEVFHLGEKTRVSEIQSVSNLKTKLKKVFADPTTIKIVKNLRNLSAHGADDNAIKAHYRPLAIGKVFAFNDGYFSQVNIFGMSGFVSKKEIFELSLHEKKSKAVQQLNNEFIVSLSFSDKVKMTISADELKILQSQAKKALSGD